MSKQQKVTKKNLLMVAAQLLFDCQMEATYRYEPNSNQVILTKIDLAKTYIDMVEQTEDIRLLNDIIEDCKKALENQDDEFIASQFEFVITYIDKFIEY